MKVITQKESTVSCSS